MRLFKTTAMMVLLLAGHPALAAKDCTAQPMPRAIEAAGEDIAGSETIEFAAEPSFEPGAWVVRLARRGDAEAMVEIVRLRRQWDCNRYDIEWKRRFPMEVSGYKGIAARVVPLGMPSSKDLLATDSSTIPGIVVDGTALQMRLRSAGWSVLRSVPYTENSDGRAISQTFQQILASLVPPSELPSPDWRMRKTRQPIAE